MTTYINSFTQVDNGNSGSAKTVDWTLGNFQKITISESTTITFTAPSGIGDQLILKCTHSLGGATVTLPANVSLNTVYDVFDTTNGVTNIVSLVYDGTNYYGHIYPQDFVGSIS